MKAMAEKRLVTRSLFVAALSCRETGMDNRTPSPTEKLGNAFLAAAGEFLTGAGFVKVAGEWVCADDLKMDAR